MIQQIRPVIPPIGRLALRQQEWPVPLDVEKSGGAQRLLIGLDIQKIILDVEWVIPQVKRPSDRRPSQEGLATRVSNPYLR